MRNWGQISSSSVFLGGAPVGLIAEVTTATGTDTSVEANTDTDTSVEATTDTDYIHLGFCV